MPDVSLAKNPTGAVRNGAHHVAVGKAAAMQACRSTQALTASKTVKLDRCWVVPHAKRVSLNRGGLHSGGLMRGDLKRGGLNRSWLTWAVGDGIPREHCIVLVEVPPALFDLGSPLLEHRLAFAPPHRRSAPRQHVGHHLPRELRVIRERKRAPGRARTSEHGRVRKNNTRKARAKSASRGTSTSRLASIVFVCSIVCELRVC
eukprot:3109739-Rhodomonas_salina.3